MKTELMEGAVESHGLMTSSANPLRYDGAPYDSSEASGLLVAAVPKGAKVLDVGCGTGWISVMVKDRCGADVIGIEPSPERARIAAARGITVYNSLFPSDLIPADGTFDVVMFADVLEHMIDPAAVLIAAHGYLKTNGIVLVSIPNVAHWTVRCDILRGRFDYRPCGIMDATHLRWFTCETLRNLFTRAGYMIETHRFSAGTTLDDYNWRFPWRWIGRRTKDRIVRALAHTRPTLFGCQHVVSARVAANREGGQ